MRNFLHSRFSLVILFSICFYSGFSQFTPVAVNGFNQDVVAEAGTSSLTTTTSALDGTTISNKVIYTEGFRDGNGFAGGGIPDNGTITDADGTYQLADYADSNALIVQRNQSADLNITTPAQYDHLRILCFSTEGTSLINVNLFFTDGTTTAALTNYSLSDWFNNTDNLVLAGIGRVTRSTPATGADAFPNNPRMYYIDIPIGCADRAKNLEKINFANITTFGNNAPFPNAVFFALSATTFSQTVAPSSTPATCTTGGTATLNVSGSGAPYTITWNTIPSQNGPTINVPDSGTYTATITDLAGCVTTDSVHVTKTDDLTLSTRGDTTVCSGTTLNANTISNAASFAWTPIAAVSNPAIANPVLSPASPNTPYALTATLGTCTKTALFTISVANQVTLTVPAATTICAGSGFTPNIVSNGTSFQWTPTTGVSDPTIANPVLSPTVSTTYTVTAFIGSCSLSQPFTVNIGEGITVDAGSALTISAGQSVQLQATAPAGTYTWSPATGLSATNILDPVASPLVTTTYRLDVVSAQGCSGFDIVEVKVIPGCAKPMNAITPNGDGINDKWLVTDGSCILSAKVSVYNRYGSPVFQSENYQNDWQGTFKGKSLPDGTYYFVVDYKLNNSSAVVSLRGNVTIVR